MRVFGFFFLEAAESGALRFKSHHRDFTFEEWQSGKQITRKLFRTIIVILKKIVYNLIVIPNVQII